MAIAQPTALMLTSGQDASWTVALSPTEDVTNWTVTVTVRAYNGGTALVTKTIGSGITVDNTALGIFTVMFSAADLTLLYGPGAYVVEMRRDNAGVSYPIIDPSPLYLRPAAATASPTITNLGEYGVHALGGITLNDAMAQQLIQLLAAAESFVRRYCGREFTYASRVEYLDAPVKGGVYVRETPLIAVTSVYFDVGGYYGQGVDAFAAESLLTSGVDYFYAVDRDGLSYSGEVTLRRGTWWNGSWGSGWNRQWGGSGLLSPNPQSIPGAIKITYTGGYRLVPMDLKRAVWDLVTYWEQGSTFGRIPTSESGEGYSRSFGSDDGGGIPMGVKAVLDLYKMGRSFVA